MESIAHALVAVVAFRRREGIRHMSGEVDGEPDAYDDCSILDTNNLEETIQLCRMLSERESDETDCFSWV